jgi:hypothetical protein
MYFSFLSKVEIEILCFPLMQALGTHMRPRMDGSPSAILAGLQ